MNFRARANNRLWTTALLILLTAPLLLAFGPGPDREVLLTQARQLMDQGEGGGGLLEAADLLEEAAVLFPEESRVPLYLAEAWFRMADPEADIEQSYPAYKKSGEYAQKALEMDGGRLEAFYWLGLAELKRAQKIGGIRAYFPARLGIRYLEKVREELPAYDNGGAARTLSLLHRLAPEWSPFGNLKKAIAYGTEAVRIAPGYPLNHLYLARAYLEAGKMFEARIAYRSLLALSPHPFEKEAISQLQKLEMTGA